MRERSPPRRTESCPDHQSYQACVHCSRALSHSSSFCGHTGCNHEQEADQREHFPLVIPIPHCCEGKRKHDNWMTSERGVIGTSFSFHDLSKQTPNKSVPPPRIIPLFQRALVFVQTGQLQLVLRRTSHPPSRSDAP